MDRKDMEELTRFLSENSTSGATQSAPNIRSGHTTTIIIIGDNNHVGHQKKAVMNTVSGQRIDSATRATLRELVDEIVAKEQTTHPDYPTYKVWQRLNEKLGVETYKDIPEAQGKRAIAYLQGWLRNITPETPHPS